MKKLLALWLALKAIERKVGQDAAWIHYSESTFEHGRNVSKRRAYVEAWFGYISYYIEAFLASKVCNKFGHKWVDDSSCGPESGDMDMYCERCGHIFHHQLY